MAIALLTRSRDAPTMPGELLLGERQPELVLAAGELEQALRGAAGDVEEHRVGERLVGRAQPPREQRHDAHSSSGRASIAARTAS